MAMVGIGLVMFGFITSWVFGREYSDHAVKDLLALPVPRSSIVIAKFMVIAVWCVFLTLVFFAFGILGGAIVQISGWTNEIFLHSISVFAGASLLHPALSGKSRPGADRADLRGNPIGLPGSPRAGGLSGLR